MPGCEWRGSGPLQESSDLFDIALPTLTETLRPLRGENQDRSWLSKVLSSADLDLAPLVVHRQEDRLPDRRRLLVFRRAQAQLGEDAFH